MRVAGRGWWVAGTAVGLVVAACSVTQATVDKLVTAEVGRLNDLDTVLTDMAAKEKVLRKRVVELKPLAVEFEVNVGDRFDIVERKLDAFAKDFSKFGPPLKEQIALVAGFTGRKMGREDLEKNQRAWETRRQELDKDLGTHAERLNECAAKLEEIDRAILKARARGGAGGEFMVDADP